MTCVMLFFFFFFFFHRLRFIKKKKKRRKIAALCRINSLWWSQALVSETASPLAGWGNIWTVWTRETQSCIKDSADPTAHSCWAGGISCLLSEAGYKVQVSMEEGSACCLFSYCGTALRWENIECTVRLSATLWYMLLFNFFRVSFYKLHLHKLH